MEDVEGRLCLLEALDVLEVLGRAGGDALCATLTLYAGGCGSFEI